jgi:hypothetical protein
VRRSFQQRSETFGFDTKNPWSLAALGLLFCVPRVYQVLAEAWDERHPGCLEALERLRQGGFVEYPKGLLVDVRTGDIVSSAGKSLDRFVLSRSGRALTREAREDLRVLEDRWPKLESQNAVGVLGLMGAFDVKGSHAAIGVSTPQAMLSSSLAERTGRWWVRKLEAEGLLVRLEERKPDSREVIPGHWRPTRQLAQQLADVFEEYPKWSHFVSRWRLGRSRYLNDIDPARIGVTGATDFDHDVNAQRILAKMLSSDRLSANAPFDVEPRIALLADDLPNGAVQFADNGGTVVLYQPDAVLVESTEQGKPCRNIIEYERYQSRRDGWAHLERFCGYMALRMHSFEGAKVRFVVDSESRVRGYVELIEAFSEYLEENPQRAPQNEITLCVASLPKVLQSPDALDDRTWHRLVLPQGAGECRLHNDKSTPFNTYFSKGVQ